MARTTKLTVGQGETLKVLVNLQNESGSALDITSSTFSGSVRETYSDPTVNVEFTFETIAPLTSGSFYIKLTPAQTAILTAQDYVYDVLKIDDSEVRRILEGPLVVRPSVTIA